MRKTLLFLVTLLMVLLLAGTASAETVERNIQLVIGDTQARIDGSNVTMSAPAQVVNGSTLVPLRFVGEAFGCDVSWNSSIRTAIVKLVDQTIEVPIGASYAVINGNKVQVKVPAQIIKGSTYVPLRFISENLGAKVDYNSGTRTVSISLKGYINEDQGFQLVLPFGWSVLEENSDGVTFSLNENCQAQVAFIGEGEGIDASNFKEFSEVCFEEFADKEVLDTQISGYSSQIIYREDGNIADVCYKLLDGGIYYYIAVSSEELMDATIGGHFDLMANTLETP
ncbi:MAG: copper amine oxidase N-terminal domain-containing protein [Deltaproteobacteria bacterium]